MGALRFRRERDSLAEFDFERVTLNASGGIWALFVRTLKYRSCPARSTSVTTLAARLTYSEHVLFLNMASFSTAPAESRHRLCCPIADVRPEAPSWLCLNTLERAAPRPSSSIARVSTPTMGALAGVHIADHGDSDLKWLVRGAAAAEQQAGDMAGCGRRAFRLRRLRGVVAGVTVGRAQWWWTGLRRQRPPTRTCANCACMLCWHVQFGAITLPKNANGPL